MTSTAPILLTYQNSRRGPAVGARYAIYGFFLLWQVALLLFSCHYHTTLSEMDSRGTTELSTSDGILKIERANYDPWPQDLSLHIQTVRPSILEPQESPDTSLSLAKSSFGLQLKPHFWLQCYISIEQLLAFTAAIALLQCALLSLKSLTTLASVLFWAACVFHAFLFGLLTNLGLWIPHSHAVSLLTALFFTTSLAMIVTLQLTTTRRNATTLATVYSLNNFLFAALLADDFLSLTIHLAATIAISALLYLPLLTSKLAKQPVHT